jgi:hypothetical protein
MPDRYEVGRKNKTVHSTVIDTRHNNCVLSAAVLAKRLNEAEAEIKRLERHDDVFLVAVCKELSPHAKRRVSVECRKILSTDEPTLAVAEPGEEEKP